MQTSTSPRPLSAMTVLAQAGGAVVGGVVLAALAYLGVGYALIGSDLGMGVLSLQVFGIIIGFGAGAGLGAALVGRMRGQGGSTWLAVALGALTGVAVILVMRLLNIGGLGGILGVGIPLVLAAAIAGYNLRRRP